MTPTATETTTLGALAVRLGDRIERIAVRTLGVDKAPEVAFNRDSAGLVNQHYSAAMEWNEHVKVWQTVKPHEGRFCISVRVKGGVKE